MTWTGYGYSANGGHGFSGPSPGQNRAAIERIINNDAPYDRLPNQTPFIGHVPMNGGWLVLAKPSGESRFYFRTLRQPEYAGYGFSPYRLFAAERPEGLLASVGSALEAGDASFPFRIRPESPYLAIAARLFDSKPVGERSSLHLSVSPARTALPGSLFLLDDQADADSLSQLTEWERVAPENEGRAGDDALAKRLAALEACVSTLPDAPASDGFDRAEAIERQLSSLRQTLSQASARLAELEARPAVAADDHATQLASQIDFLEDEQKKLRDHLSKLHERAQEKGAADESISTVANGLASLGARLDTFKNTVRSDSKTFENQTKRLETRLQAVERTAARRSAVRLLGLLGLLGAFAVSLAGSVLLWQRVTVQNKNTAILETRLDTVVSDIGDLSDNTLPKLRTDIDVIRSLGAEDQQERASSLAVLDERIRTIERHILKLQGIPAVDLAALQGLVVALKLSDAQSLNEWMAARQQQIVFLEGRLDEISNAPLEGQAAENEARLELAERIVALEDRLRQLTRPDDAASPLSLPRLAGRIGALEDAMRDIGSADPGASADVVALGARIAALEQQLSYILQGSAAPPPLTSPEQTTRSIEGDPASSPTAKKDPPGPPAFSATDVEPDTGNAEAAAVAECADIPEITVAGCRRTRVGNNSLESVRPKPRPARPPTEEDDEP